jgi:hypothetical protein
MRCLSASVCRNLQELLDTSAARVAGRGSLQQRDNPGDPGGLVEARQAAPS